MFEIEPDVAQRRAAPASERSDPSTEGAGSPRLPGMRDAASLLHLQRTAGNASVVQMLADDAAQEPDQDQPSPVHDVVGKGGVSAAGG